jgi:hypothetical protein
MPQLSREAAGLAINATWYGRTLHHHEAGKGVNTQNPTLARHTLETLKSPPFHLWIAHRCGASYRGKNDKGFSVSFVRYFNELIISCVRKSHPNAANHLNCVPIGRA